MIICNKQTKEESMFVPGNLYEHSSGSIYICADEGLGLIRLKDGAYYRLDAVIRNIDICKWKNVTHLYCLMKV